MLDMRHHVGQRRLGRRIGGGPGGQPGLHRAGIAGVQGLQPRLLARLGPVPGPHRLGHETGRQVDHHDAAVLRHHSQHPIRHVARMIRDRPRRRMREDHRRIGHAHGVQHRLLGDVAEVDHHAQPIHLFDHRLAERAEPAPFRRVRRAVGPGRGLGVGQGHVARAGPVELPQQGQGIVDRIAALHPDQAGDPARFEHRIHLVRRGRQAEGVGMGGDDAFGRVDLLEGFLDRLQRRQAGRHIDGPELPPDTAGPQARDIGVQFGRRHQILRQIDGVDIVPILLSQRPRQVVVPVDQRRGLQNLHHSRLIGVLSLGHPSQRERGDGDGDETADHGRAS